MSELITTRVRDNALRLGLTHLADGATQLVARAEADNLGYLDLVDLLLEEELGLREGRRFRNALKLSGLPHHKTIDEFDFAFQTDLDPRKIRDLAALTFVADKSNVALLGPPGVGKTHIAVALAVAACQAGYSIYFTSLDDLVRQLKLAEATGRFARKLQTYLRPAVLVLDEVGYLPLGREEAKHGLPARLPQIRARLDRAHLEQGIQRMGPRLLRRRPRHRHPRPAAAPLRRHINQRTQLPTQRTHRADYPQPHQRAIILMPSTNT
jgi:DNA replication protein DnaC